MEETRSSIVNQILFGVALWCSALFLGIIIGEHWFSTVSREVKNILKRIDGDPK